MGHLIRPASVKIITQEGKCDIHITLDLNINVNGVSGVSPSKKGPLIEEDDDDKVQWEIPTFESSEKISFGKKEEIKK